MEFADFGRYLTQQRELRGMSREDVSRSTRIPLTLIAALEDGQMDRLPARVFVINYIRSYAQEIGLHAEEAVLRFEEIDRTAQTTPPPAALERARRRKALATLALLVLGLLAASYAMLVLLGHVATPRGPR